MSVSVGPTTVSGATCQLAANMWISEFAEGARRLGPAVVRGIQLYRSGLYGLWKSWLNEVGVDQPQERGRWGLLLKTFVKAPERRL